MSSSNASSQTPQLTEVVLPGAVEPDGLIVRHRPIPTPGEGEVLVRMLAAGVSFAEQGMRRNLYPGQPRFPFVPGYDLVGEVVDGGGGVEPSLIGRRIAAVTKTGAWSTHVILTPGQLIPVPETVDPAELETILLNGITAWQMLHRSAGARAGDTILVHGASGGVGSVLLQLARHAGIRVVGTASRRNHDLLRALGAEPLDYHDGDLGDQVRAMAPDGLDAVFDNIGGASFERSFGLLADHGTLVAYGTAGQIGDTSNLVLAFAGILAQFALWHLTPNHGRRATFYNFWAGKLARPKRFRQRLADDLGQLIALLAEGKLTPLVAARLPLGQAAQALALAESGTVQGKVVLTP